MAYTSGTAINYLDLLATLATFVTANGWTILEQSETQLYLRGEGAGGLDEIYCGIGAFANTGSGYYNWALYGSIAYRAGRGYASMPMSSGGGSYVYLWNAAIPYWFVANGRRIVMVAKVGTVYEVLYLGLGNVPAADCQYPYPLIVGGCGYTSTLRYSDTGGGHAAFIGRDANSGESYTFGRIMASGGLWHNINMTQGTAETAYPRWVSASRRGQLLTAPDGSYLVEEIWLAGVTYRNGHYLMARVEGLHAITGYNNSSENVISIDGVNYLVFQDVYRTGYGNYFALRLA